MNRIDNITSLTTQKKVIILSNNHYLALGISEILHDFICICAKLNSGSLLESFFIEDYSLVLIDDNIFNESSWETYKDLRITLQTSKFVWIASVNDAHIYPNGCENDFILSRNCELLDFKKNIYLLANHEHISFKTVGLLHFTYREKVLFNLLLRDPSIHRASKKLNKPIKQLYFFRNNILKKTGFKTYDAFHSFCSRNIKYISLPYVLSDGELNTMLYYLDLNQAPLY